MSKWLVHTTVLLGNGSAMPSGSFCAEHGSAKESLKSMQLPPGNNYNAKSTGCYKWHSSKRGELVSSVSLPCFASGIFLPKEYHPVPRTAKDGGGAAHQPFQVWASGSQKLWAKKTSTKPSTDIATSKSQGKKACWRWFLTTRLETKPHLEQPCLYMSLSYSKLND